MFFLYILQSDIDGKYYIGSTNDLNRRLEEHNRGQTKSTKFRKPFKLVFYKEFETNIEVHKIELKLKRFKNSKIIDRIVAGKVLILRS